MPKEPELQTRKISELVFHPDQTVYFEPLDDMTLRALADDIARNGQLSPVEILPENSAGLPAGTILDGTQRCRAIELGGGNDVKVSVRYDLADAPRATIDLTFLGYNLNRRQLDAIARARIAKRQLELEQAGNGDISIEELRRRVGAHLGVQPRQVARLLALLDCPLEVQNAVRSTDRDVKLPMALACRVSFLPTEVQQQVAARIRAGERPRLVVDEALAAANLTRLTQYTIFRRLETVTSDCQGLLDALCAGQEGSVLPAYEDVLRAAATVVDQLLALVDDPG